MKKDDIIFQSDGGISEKKVLIISMHFPPILGGASTVMYNLCKNLPEDSFYILTSKEGYKADKNFKINCRIDRIQYQIIWDLSLITILTTSFSIIWNGLMIYKKDKYQAIMGVYPTIHGLIGAYFLHKILRKPLVVYMHDYFSETYSPNRALLMKMLTNIERRILSSSSKILVPTERFREHYNKLGFKNVVVFPHSIDIEEEYKSFVRSGKTLRIVYTGEIYWAHENAVRTFIKTIKDIPDLEVIFATSNSEAYLKEYNIGFLKRKECIELQRTADVLFLPLAFKSPSQLEISSVLPSKTLEYLAAGKPILALVPKNSYVEKFVKQNEVGIALNELSHTKIKEAIDKLRDEDIRNKYSFNEAKILKEFDAKKRADEFLSILSQLK